jgi:hypothetical protein
VSLSGSDLLSGEQVLARKNANALVGIVQAGLGSMGSVSMTGTEAVGGQLYLTDLRLVFRAHRANRLQAVSPSHCRRSRRSATPRRAYGGRSRSSPPLNGSPLSFGAWPS